jgi:hypothetical protein
MVGRCAICDGCGWVCEAHPDSPWEGPRAMSLRRRGHALPGLRRQGRSHRTSDATGLCRGRWRAASRTVDIFRLPPTEAASLFRGYFFSIPWPFPIGVAVPKPLLRASFFFSICFSPSGSDLLAHRKRVFRNWRHHTLRAGNGCDGEHHHQESCFHPHLFFFFRAAYRASRAAFCSASSAARRAATSSLSRKSWAA